jgi:DNA polymerase I-like protein with 3'-5' exonuclease and polymerase domains
MKVAQNRGYIKTLLGRHRHFNLYEPADSYQMRKVGKDTTPYTYDLAKKKYPGLPLKRAYTYKALNALIQGSAADMTKAAMLKVWKELGLVPHMQVHDELNYSVPDQDTANMIRLCMETCVDTSTPMLAEMELGGNWK